MHCYFHLVSDNDIIADRTGVEVSNLAAAAAEAFRAIQELRDEGNAADEDWEGWQLEVADGAGHVLLSIPLNPVPHQRKSQVPRRMALLA